MQPRGDLIMDVPLLRDIVFRKVFAEEKNSEPILRALLNAILGLTGEKRITSLEINDPHLLDNFDGKNSVLDIKATDQRGYRYNIEVQLLRHAYFPERCLYYWGRLYSENFKKNAPYSQLKRTLVIAIVDHPFEKKHLHNIYRIRSVYDDLDFSEHLEIHTLDLTKFNKREPGSLVTALDKWLHFLKYSLYYQETGSPRPPELVLEEGIDEAMTSYQRASSSRELRSRIELQEKAEHDRISREAEALSRGIEQGKLQSRLESARQAFAIGLSCEQAAAVSGLTLDEVLKIKSVLGNVS